MAESSEGNFTPEEAAEEIAEPEPRKEYETKPVPDIISEPGNPKIEQIPPGEFWAIDTISHAEIEVPRDSGIRAEIVSDAIFKIEAGATVDIPEGSEEVEIIEHKLAA